MSGIGVVLNPKSRQNRRDPKAAGRLVRALGDDGILREARSLDDLHRIAEDFKRLQIDVLGISGGDGTNHVTLSGFLDVYKGSALPQVAFLRGGTMNTIANACGIRRGPPEGLLERLLVAYRERAVSPLANVERHVMKVGNRYGFLFGAGVVHGFLAEYYENEDPNPLIAAKTLARLAGSAITGGEVIRRAGAPFRGTVELDDGTTWPLADYTALAAGTIDQIGLGFRPFHRYAERENAFHILGIYAEPARLTMQLPKIFRAEAMDPGHARDAVTSRAVIRSAELPLRYMIDGDLHEIHGDLVVSVGPKVRIVVGT